MALRAGQKELNFSLSITAISAVFLFQSFAYPAESSSFPRFLTILMLFFSLMLLIKSIRERVADFGAIPRTETSRTSYFSLPRKRKVALFIFAGTLLYVGAIQYIGYFVSTIVFFVGMMTLFGRHKLLISLCTSAAFLLVMYALFVKFLGLRLPEGLLL